MSGYFACSDSDELAADKKRLLERQALIAQLEERQVRTDLSHSLHTNDVEMFATQKLDSEDGAKRQHLLELQLRQVSDEAARIKQKEDQLLDLQRRLTADREL